MSIKKTIICALSAAFILTAGSELFARDAGMGTGQRLRDGSCLTTQTKTAQKLQTMDKIRLQDCTLTKTGTPKMSSKDFGQGQMRRLGPGDGTGNTTRPLDGTGYGSPAVKP